MGGRDRSPQSQRRRGMVEGSNGLRDMLLPILGHECALGRVLIEQRGQRRENGEIHVRY
jgi:hypothetical protein